MSAPDIIWLFETPRWAWADDDLGIEWDSEDERFVDEAGSPPLAHGVRIPGALSW